MNEPHQSEKSIFLAAIEIGSAAERAEFLDSACAGNLPLRAEVDALLQAHDKPQRLLDNPTASTATIDEPTAERPGTVIGPYKLLQQIGEGGFGTVYMAEQTHPVQRKVAIKVIKPGMDSRQVIARFEAERQALALMDHVNIARVFDGGATDSGRPYFVMELVHGVPITKYCDDHHLTTNERLELFVPVCQAIQHAHQKGIIHRDIKPSNVMITLYDGKPVPKVIDFGAAKATELKLTERTLFTQYGMMVGTFEYMSPEQAETSALGVDTRSDIYSLGVLLYELLTGTTPLSHKRVREATYAEILRMIKEEEPPKPSTRISTLEQAATTAAEKRRSDPRKLRRLLRGELDWIVMKALEKDRNRRYETANAFAMDIQRYLADEPVLACPPSAPYRLRKFVRRHKGTLAVGTALLTLLLAGTAVSAWQAVRATRAEGDTNDALARVTAEQAKTEAALEAETAAKSQAREALDTLIDDVVETMFTRQPVLDETEKAFLRKVLEMYDKFTLQLGETAEARCLRARGYYQVAHLRALLGEQDNAVADYLQAVILFGQLANDFADVPEYREKLGHSYHNLGALLGDLGKEVEAETAYRQSLASQEKLVDDFPLVHPYRRNLAASYTDQAILLTEQHKYADAEAANRHALELLETLPADAGATPAVRQALARTRSNQGRLLRLQAKDTQAEEFFRQALDVQEKLVGEFPAVPRCRRDLADTCNGLGIALAELRKDAKAETAFDKAVALRKKLADDFPKVLQYREELAGAYHDLGVFLRRQRRYADAEAAYRRALDIREKIVAETGAVPRYRRELAQSYDQLGILLWSAGGPNKAGPPWREALAIREQLAAEFPEVPDYQNEVAVMLVKLATLHNQNREFAAAAALLEQARPHNLAAIEADPKNPAYRLCCRNNLQTGAQCHLGLADHAQLATSAEDLARLSYDPAGDTYNAACLLCRCMTLAEKDAQLAEARRKELAQSYADRAMALLRQAVAGGFKNAAHMKKDPDLEPLRAREEFRQLLADLDGNTNMSGIRSQTRKANGH